LLGPGRVVVPLRAATLPAAVAELIEACVADGQIADAPRLLRVVADAWPEDTVSMGPHAFLPHFRTDAVTGIVAALGVAAAPIREGPRDPREARLVLLVLAPPRQAGPYLQAVAAFARALARPDVVAGLLDAKRPEDVLALPGLDAIELEGQLLVRDIMSPRVWSVGPETPLSDAAHKLIEHGISAMPVVGERGEVIGLLSDRELLRYLVPAYVQRVTTGQFPAAHRPGTRRPDPAGMTVREAMSRTVFCLSEDQTVADVANLLATKDVDRFPVVRDGVLAGFLTRTDIVRKVVGRS
jgi:CBS domain-containing protein